ncbi:MAG: hypothetical protein AMR96_03185 [Candidatus Adiutrix intracellularis]|nr:MAG: hypothetical protein AMR96_03185 [Candidatus Adiutrix intracellularis]
MYELLEFEVNVHHGNNYATDQKGYPKKNKALRKIYFIKAKLHENAEAIARKLRSLYSLF